MPVVEPPIAPMLAKLSRELPLDAGLFYEPKWDGFRCIVFRDGDSVTLGSRNEKPLDRYFPEIVDAVRSILPDRCVIDGEIVIASSDGLDFDLLSQRFHPAASRIEMLAKTTPASFVAFDLLALGDEDMMGRPYAQRRARLEETLEDVRPPIYITPVTTDPVVARDWFHRFKGAGLDGVVAKQPDLSYQPDKRVMIKVKHERTADCVVGGFRWHKDGISVGSLLLGLVDDAGVLHHVGVASGFSTAMRSELVDTLAPHRKEAVDAHPWVSNKVEGQRVPGAPSRWSSGKDLSWEPIEPTLVVEVAYGQLQGDRFRHATSFVRWRPDREPRSCTYSQLEGPAPIVLKEVFGATP